VLGVGQEDVIVLTETSIQGFEALYQKESTSLEIANKTSNILKDIFLLFQSYFVWCNKSSSTD